MRSDMTSGKTVALSLSSGKGTEDALTCELERLKEELELVSYLTSHDLQAPLRIMFSFCEKLARHPALNADEEGKEAVRVVMREATHMKALLQGLLDYLRLETFDPSHALVDGNEVVAAAMETLQDKIRSTGARITCDKLPQVYGHRGRLTRLFASLFDNALKFSKSGPVVHVAARSTGNRCEFSVRDNGIGIDEEYHSIIFGLFQRLHTAEEYPGNGAGLALCRKIVEAHDGKISVESSPGAGSCFRFTLPVTPQGRPV